MAAAPGADGTVPEGPTRDDAPDRWAPDRQGPEDGALGAGLARWLSERRGLAGAVVTCDEQAASITTLAAARMAERIGSWRIIISVTVASAKFFFMASVSERCCRYLVRAKQRGFV